MIEIVDRETGSLLQTMSVRNFMLNFPGKWRCGVQQAIVDFNETMISVCARLA